MKISVCMIVRNESAMLRNAIQSIPQNYEKIIVDTGSNDGTIELAESLGARVFSFEWIEDFGAARNESIRHANGDYILVLDADEQLSEDTASQIEAHIQEHPDKAAIVSIWNLIDGEVHRSHMVRFFPNSPKFRFEGVVHEQLFENEHLAQAVQSGIELIHHGYSKEIYESQNKEERYLSLYRKHLQSHPNDGYTLYQLGKLHFSMHRYEDALEALNKCLAQEEEDHLYFPPMIVMYGYALKNLNRSKEAEDLLTGYLPQYPNFPDLPFLLGLLAMDTMKLDGIEANFIRALEIGETTKYSTVAGVGTYKAAYNLGVYYEVIGDKARAMTAYGIAAEYQYAPALNRLQQIVN